GRRVTMIDPNIRPGFITDEARYRARIRSMLIAADIIKVSDEDLDWLGMDVQEMLDHDTKLVCLTEGSKGVRAYWQGGETFVAANKVEVVDTVGAGDTFNAGLLAGLNRAGILTKDGLAALDETSVIPALELGVKAAAITVSRAGANPPWEHEL
ncbi:MAG: PfkB family carbohydrate kinase, partial [Maritimibacter sp.]